MTTKCNKVLVIGAGVSGITATKCCMDEELDVVCVERTDSIGGLWNYTEEAKDGQACVAKSTVINTSKEMTSFSDYPADETFANYMHNKKLMQYFTSYVKHFGVDKKIRFRTEVLSLTKSEDYDSTGRWNVHLKDLNTLEETHEIYDAVLVCTGHHADKNMPTFPGQQTFTGQIIHSHDYKHQKGFEDKKIVVVGIGNSGVDVAVELARVAEQLYLSTRRGTWVFKRVSHNGLPLDIARINRFTSLLQHKLPTSLVEWWAQRELNGPMDHERYRLKPKHGVQQAHPTVNDDLANRIACGSIKVKADIAHISGSDVHFTDGTVERDIDVIFACTGYVFGFPFIDSSVLKVEDNESELYKYMFPPKLTRHTLAVIGYIQPLGSIMPISELQSRVACRVFKGLTKLPSEQDMMQNIATKRKAMQKRYVKSTRHTIQVNYVRYMDELAEIIGVKPDLWHVFKTDPLLAIECFFGPCTPYQYRLVGPGAWSGARQAIMTQMERIEKATATRPSEGGKSPLPMNAIMVAIIVVVLAILLATWL